MNWGHENIRTRWDSLIFLVWFEGKGPVEFLRIRIFLTSKWKKKEAVIFYRETLLSSTSWDTFTLLLTIFIRTWQMNHTFKLNFISICQVEHKADCHWSLLLVRSNIFWCPHISVPIWSFMCFVFVVNMVDPSSPSIVFVF